MIDPVDCGVTLIWTLALAPLAIVPTGHVTVPADWEQLPCARSRGVEGHARRQVCR